MLHAVLTAGLLLPLSVQGMDPECGETMARFTQIYERRRYFRFLFIPSGLAKKRKKSLSGDKTMVVPLVVSAVR